MEPLKRVLFVFLDGVGLGPDVSNPFKAARGESNMNRLADVDAWTASRFVAARTSSMARIPLDACLGVEGLPQSGTGQATLFTGRNCAKIAGRHYGPYPHSTTRATLKAWNIFSQLRRARRAVAFANAYPPVFFEYAKRTDRWPVTTRCCLDAEVPIRRSSQIVANEAVPADLTAERLQKRDSTVPLIREEDSASKLLAISEQNHLTLFEYYLTDKAGHARDAKGAADVLESLDRFLGALDDMIDFSRNTLVITSDHGNLEDLSTKSHTRNPVPLLAKGWAAPCFHDAHDLTDVVPAIVEALNIPGN